MSEVRYILRRIEDKRVLCRPDKPGCSVSWQPQTIADNAGITMEYPSLEGANVGLKVYGSTGRIEVVIQEKSDEAPTVSERITDYLSAGGLFNPELMEHDKVRDLIIDAGDELGVGPLTPTVEDSRSTEILCGRP